MAGYRNEQGGRQLLELTGTEVKDLPLIVFEDGERLINPSIVAIADKIGLPGKASKPLYDVAIAGAGPAGLAAGVYGASEGLKTIVIEKRAPGGQAGTSSRIENYLGFPKGLSGADLSRWAITQAMRLGAEFITPLEAVDIKLTDNYKTIVLSDRLEINALSVVIATGGEYRTLDAKSIERFTGAGIYSGSATTEAKDDGRLAELVLESDCN